MTDKTSKNKHKRLPKSQRIYTRRLKQAARKAGLNHHDTPTAQTRIEEKTEK